MFMYNGVFMMLCDVVVFYNMCLIDFGFWYYGVKMFDDVLVVYCGNINVNLMLMNCWFGMLFVLIDVEIDDIVVFFGMLIDVCYMGCVVLIVFVVWIMCIVVLVC